MEEAYRGISRMGTLAEICFRSPASADNDSLLGGEVMPWLAQYSSGLRSFDHERPFVGEHGLSALSGRQLELKCPGRGGVKLTATTRGRPAGSARSSLRQPRPGPPAGHASPRSPLRRRRCRCRRSGFGRPPGPAEHRRRREGPERVVVLVEHGYRRERLTRMSYASSKPGLVPFSLRNPPYEGLYGRMSNQSARR